MDRTKVIALIALAGFGACTARAGEGAVPLLPGRTFRLAGRAVTVEKADVLPYASNT